MEPPPPSGGAISTAPTAAATVTQPPPPSVHANYADSDFSPRSRNTDSWDEPAAYSAAQGGGKLRMMCSYGGHIVPRPHDKSLCYVGGDTRIIVADRHTSLSELSLRLSKTLLNGHSFLLKYQLPNEDLDSLISVTTDEDFENMIDEYDRINANSTTARASRLRVFLFPSQSEAVSSIGSLIESSTKPEDWFLHALNGAISSSAKVFSESSSVNCLLGLGDDIGNGNSTGKVAEAQLDGKHGRVNNAKINAQDVHSVPDSPMVETTSSFGSASSSPSMANLPPIRVHEDENRRTGGIEEQLSQMTVGAGAGARVEQKQQEDACFEALSSPPAPPALVAGTVASIVPAVVGGENLIRPLSKAPAPPDLPSPDSISSEGSLTNPLSRQQKQYIYQEPTMQIQPGSRVSASDQNTMARVQNPVQDSGYVLPNQYDHHPQMHQQQPYLHAGQFIHHTPAGTVPMTSFYPMYTSQNQHHPRHPALEHQYPVYFVQARPTQPYNLHVQQTNYSESAPTTMPNRPQTPLPHAIVTPTPYNPSRTVPASKPEMALAGQHPQYVGFSQIHHPSQSIAPASAATANYAYEFADPKNAQVYYTQPLPPQMGAQHQTMTSVHTAVLPEASIPVENFKQQTRNSHP